MAVQLDIDFEATLAQLRERGRKHDVHLGINEVYLRHRIMKQIAENDLSISTHDAQKWTREKQKFFRGSAHVQRMVASAAPASLDDFGVDVTVFNEWLSNIDDFVDEYFSSRRDKSFLEDHVTLSKRKRDPSFESHVQVVKDVTRQAAIAELFNSDIIDYEGHGFIDEDVEILKIITQPENSGFLRFLTMESLSKLTRQIAYTLPEFEGGPKVKTAFSDAVEKHGVLYFLLEDILQNEDYEDYEDYDCERIRMDASTNALRNMLDTLPGKEVETSINYVFHRLFSENSVLLRHLTFDAPEHLRTVVQRRQAGLTKLVNNRIHILCLDDLNIDRDLMNEVAGEVNNLQATDIEMLIEKYGFDGGKRSSFGLTKVQEKRILDAFEYYDYWDVCDMDVSKEQVFAFLADQNGVVQSRATEVAKFLEDYAEAFDKACKPKANV